ncbi:hypothetical protein ACE10W_16720 [Bradyrhizobium sp. B025]|jgi:hypothetical protein|uniref:hypothetical protein n=1 Tax=Bradyrhizobium sp. B025 TaxID=3344829 RepID=UPI0035D452B9
MKDLYRLVFDSYVVRRAIVFNYGWAIHVSPEEHLDSICKNGLIANKDAGIPEDLNEIVRQPKVLCMHPLGAKKCPPPACNTIEPRTDIGMVTFAVNSEDIPQRVHLDWSNAWHFQANDIFKNQRLNAEELVRRLLVEYGSFVTYDTISPDKLRVFCEGNQPTNPLDWPALLAAQNISTFVK